MRRGPLGRTRLVARTGQSRSERAGDVTDVDEVPTLATVLEHPWCLAAVKGAGEERRDPGVGGFARHAGSEDVVQSQRDRCAARLAGPDRAEVLLGDLGRRIRVARVHGRVLTHHARQEVGTTDGARRLKATV